MSAATGTADPTQRKRKRLSHACSACRARKVRCDERLPKCTNCVKAGTECITFDPRNPTLVVERREAQKSYRSPSSTTCTPPGHLELPVQTPRRPNAHSHVPAPMRQSLGSGTPRTVEPQPAWTQELLPALPRFTGGNSLYMLTQWLDLAFARMGIAERFSNYYGRDRQSTRRIIRQSSNPLTKLTTNEVVEYAQPFMESINTTFPIFTEPSMDRLLQDWESLHGTGSTEEDQNVATLLVVLIVAAASSVSLVHLSANCLEFALSSLHILVEESSVRSTQALFLMALVLRCRDEIELSSQIITLAASIAQTLGLHRQVSRKQYIELGEQRAQQHICTWWAIYALEKIVSFELGRLSIIRDFECNQSLPAEIHLPHSDTQNSIFHSLIELTKLQSEASERFAMSRHIEESASDVRPVIRAKMEMAGELDQKLLHWAQSLPSHIRPQDYSVCEPELLSAASFLALQYWQTLFQLHRNALLINSQVIAAEVDIHFTDEPYRFRLRSGHSISCNAARSIVSTLNNVYENNASSVLNSSHAPLIAIYALAIHIIRNPRSGLSKADFEIQANAMRIIAKHQECIGKLGHPDSQALRALIENLHSQVATRLTGNLFSANRPNGRRHDGSGSGEGTISTFSEHSSRPLPLPSLTPTMSPGAARRAMDEGTGSLPSAHEWQLTIGNPDVDFLEGILDDINIDWDALALAYDLPS